MQPTRVNYNFLVRIFEISSKLKDPTAQLARKYGLGKHKFKVGHAGIIIFDKQGNTSYADFGRFSGATEGMGITRFQQSNLSTANAIFDANGKITNSNDIVKSLVGGENYFSQHKYGGKIMYSALQGLNYGSMVNYIQGVGSMQFGFGDGRNYCSQFAYNTLRAGGAKLKNWNMEQLLGKAMNIMDEKGLMGIPKALKLIQSGPTGENIINEINSKGSEQTGTFKY